MVSPQEGGGQKLIAAAQHGGRKGEDLAHNNLGLRKKTHPRYATLLATA